MYDIGPILTLLSAQKKHFVLNVESWSQLDLWSLLGCGHDGRGGIGGGRGLCPVIELHVC